MYKMSRQLIVFAFVASAFGPFARASAEVCALTIQIVGNRGEPTKARVLVTNASSDLVADIQTDAEGKASVCDLGFGEHHVEISTPFCHSILIDKVRFVYPHPLYFKLDLPPCGTPEEGAVVGNSCGVYLRVRSEDGSPVGRATLKYSWIPEFQEKTDTFGRLQTLIPLGDAGSLVTATAPGFEPTQIQVTCDRQMYREELIVLRRKKK